MRAVDVPQDSGLFGPWHEVTYAVDAQGRFVLTPSAGWEAANLANRQAWTVIHEQVEEARAAVRAGQLSPLAVWMALYQMDAALLGRYAGLWRWRVRRHLRPEVFARLDAAVLERYARVFRIPPAALRQVPDIAALPAAEEI